MNFFFDTNFYRYLVQDTQLGLINFDQLKFAEKENNHNILFSNIVATELINHLNDNDFQKDECFKALKYLYNHTTIKTVDNNERYGVIPTFHHILKRYFFNESSNTDSFNKSVFLFSKEISLENLNNNDKIDFINQIIDFKTNERKDIIQYLEEVLIIPWSNSNESNWNILNEKNKRVREIKKDLGRHLKDGNFHNNLALSFYNLAKEGDDLNPLKSKKVFLNDFKNSLDFIIKHIFYKVGISENLKNHFSKKWNSFYDMQLILGLEYYNRFSKTKLITNDQAVFDQLNSNNQQFALSKEIYLKQLNLWSMKNKFYQYIQNLQDTIVSGLEAVDGQAKFKEDLWERPEGGGGRTRVIENGAVFEKGGVNISAVHGKLPDSMQKLFNVGEADFFACGLSLVLHPKNPMVPTVHANWRYFEMYDDNGNVIQQWFGGGQDLTPYYLFEEDATHFHQTCKTACDKHNSEFYPKYKKQCDTYFWNAHRNEARGIGGLFFDYCKATEAMSMEKWFNFVTEVGNSFLEAYVPIVERRKNLEYTQEQKTWQEIRRGRYVEFNLVHDKGTLFGLKTNGRIESILMSLPPHVQWVYDHHPEAGSEEEKLINILENPIEWV